MAVNAYTALPNGMTRFTDHTGRSLVAFGPQADMLKQQVDRLRGATAQYDPTAPLGSAASVPPDVTRQPGPARQVADVGPNMSVAPGPAPAASVGPATVEPRMPPPVGLAPPQGPALPPPRPQLEGPAPGPAGPAEPSDLLPPEMIAGHVLRKRRVGGRAAFDPVAADAARAPVRTSQVVSGAIPETEEEKAERKKTEGVLRSEMDAAAEESRAANEEAIAAASQRRTDAYNATLAAEMEQREAANRRREIEDRYEAKRTQVQKELDAANSMKADPERLWKEKGTGARILSSIGIALGAYGASVNGGPNFALEIVNKAIDRDIDAQMDEIRRKGASANNALADLSRERELSIEEARDVMRMAANNHVAARAEMVASQMGTADARQKAAAIRAQTVQANAKFWADWSESYKGRVATQSTFMDPQRATGGGYRDPTAAEIKADAEAFSALKKATGATGDPDQIRAAAEARKAVSEEHRVALDKEKQIQEYGKRRADIDQAKDTLIQYAEALGGAVDDAGNVKWSDKDIPGTGLFDSKVPTLLSGKEARTVEQKRQWLRANIGKKLSGASVSPQQDEMIQALLAANNEEQAKEGVETLLRNAREERRNTDASFGDSVVQSFERNESESSRRKTAQTKEVEPY